MDLSADAAGPAVREAKRLNLGAGEEKPAGYINVDRHPLTGADIMHDLNRFPYPFADASIDEVRAFHVIEHLDRPFEVMRELHRILKPGGVLHIKVPHFSRGFTHAEHTHGFDITFPLYFNPSFTKSGYYGIHFKLELLRLHWFAFPHLLGHLGYSKATTATLKGISAALSFLANLAPAFASRIWCFWVGGFDEIEMRFICIK
jgi:SAM-dependent methyltransferase